MIAFFVFQKINHLPQIELKLLNPENDTMKCPHIEIINHFPATQGHKFSNSMMTYFGVLSFYFLLISADLRQEGGKDITI